jgi:hypothetical protein
MLYLACALDPGLSLAHKKRPSGRFLLFNQELLAQYPRGLEALFSSKVPQDEEASSAGASSGGAWVCLMNSCAAQMPTS